LFDEMNRGTVEAVMIAAIFYVLLLAGIWFLYSDPLRSMWGKIRMRNRLKARKKAMEPETPFEKHLRNVMSISLKKPMAPKEFIGCNAMLCITILIAGIRTVSVLSALMMAVLIGAMPYLLLRVRVETIRRKSSYEGEKLISEFVCQYRMSGMNIYKSIEQVILVSEGTKVTGKLLFKLLLELRNTGDPQVVKDATERFAYGINTGWSRMLANCIRISAEHGTNVSLALEDIQIQLREARQLYEERRRLNAESARMVVFLAPFLYVGTIIMSVKYLDMPFGRLIRNQFYTEQGFLLILLIFFLFLVNLALIEIINNQRFDY
jgi:Flp pilus assembly protein TadB